MNMSRIKNKANELLTFCKPQMMRICFILALLELIPTLLGESENIILLLIYLIVVILFVVVKHGYVVSSLKIARNNSQTLSDDDAFVGFRRFTELFPTYILMDVIAFGILFVLMFILFMGVGIFIGSMPLPDISGSALLGDSMVQATYLLTESSAFFFMIMFILVVLVIAMIFVSAYMFAAPYLLEEYHMTGSRAIKESFAFMKGHVFEFVKLELSFIGYMVLVAAIQSVLGMALSFIPVIGVSLAVLIADILAVYLYIPKYYVAKAIFFEEIAYYRYQQEQGECYE